MQKQLTIILAFVVSLGYSQIKLQGVVKDSIGNPLELANVVAINQETSALESYGITNDKGKFILNLSKNSTYKLQVSYIGMKTYEEILKTTTEDIDKDISMVSDNQLDVVELTYEMPVTISGDTLIYNADSFKNGTERKLEDILEKLPGVEVNDEGQIEVEGQRVSKVMVEGKDFFDGDSKLATKNIPSNAVDKVQVLKNYAEVGQLSSVTNNQDNYAINIKLKEGKKSFWFGNVTAGGGASTDNELYLFQPKLFYYSPKYSINLIGDLNNTGEPALTRSDLRGFGGGFRPPSRDSGTNLSLGNNSLGFLATQNNRAQDIENKLASGNFSYSPTKALDISGFGIFNSSRVDIRQKRSIQYSNPNSGIPDDETDQMTTQRSDIGLLKLSTVYKPNINNQLDYDVLGRLTKESQEQNLESFVLGNTNEIEDNTPYSISQNLNYYYTLNDDNIFALEVQHLLQDEDPFYNAILEDKDNYGSIADNLGLDPDQIGYNVNQNRRVKSNQMDAKLDYWNILNDRSNINFTLGAMVSRQDFNSNLFQLLDDGSSFDPVPTDNDGLDTNDTQYNFSDYYLGVKYTLKAGIFTFTPGVSAHAYRYGNEQFGVETQDNFGLVLPSFETRIQFKKSESLTLRYNMRNQFTDVTRLASGIVLNSFNSINIGNPELQNAVTNNVSLFYRSFNLFNYTNVFASVTYSNAVDQIRSIADFESVVRTNNFFNSGFADESVSSFGRIQRTFGKFRLSLNARVSYSKFNQFVQGERSINESFSQSYTPEIRSNFKEAPNFRIRYRYAVNNNEQGGRSTKFTTNAPSIDFDAYIWKKFTFLTDYTYNRQSNPNGSPQEFEIWNASLSYRKNRDAKWEYTIKATNLLNTTRQVQNGNNNVSVFASEYFIQPRFVTFRLRYEI
ncbi:carboxypeptidase-like regulatory domain-containing protein [Hyunsoonleella sp. SJ7]|uniref:Carboxypeptidase-like regulatory domain-containing protein n=1 Tax=Hyunsoonleella aquatilis TaxID=2762758 RepID=A0A923HGN1_9FLAO|nr:carboxypeptidase regulatory-like domain-containing protein [Hyunsoonleella aquatilis]MBC3758057.1 carboxypeptidase-like regulatory domain-containing protein [Hyunsoonleella aquatilis]